MDKTTRGPLVRAGLGKQSVGHHSQNTDTLCPSTRSILCSQVSTAIIHSTNTLSHSRRALFRVFNIRFGQIEDISGIILAKEFFKKTN